MQFALVFTLFLVGALCEEYTSKYDNVDLDSILQNDRLLKNYVDCLLEKGKCTKDGEELKKDIPEAIQNECQKCSEKHRDGIRKVVKFLSENKKEWWNELVNKYDPEGLYRAKYEELRKKEGVEI